MALLRLVNKGDFAEGAGQSLVSGGDFCANGLLRVAGSARVIQERLTVGTR
jgi:hypothetical protein